MSQFKRSVHIFVNNNTIFPQRLNYCSVTSLLDYFGDLFILLHNTQHHLDSSGDPVKWSEIKASGRCPEAEECQIEKGEIWILDESMRLV